MCEGVRKLGPQGGTDTGGGASCIFFFFFLSFFHSFFFFFFSFFLLLIVAAWSGCLTVYLFGCKFVLLYMGEVVSFFKLVMKECQRNKIHTQYTQE